MAAVCGCDGQTYGNDCLAYAAGVNVAAAGECQQPGTKTHTVQIKNMAFVPNLSVITAGDTIIWTNLDNMAHTVTSVDVTGNLTANPLDSPSLTNNKSYSHTFEQPGSFKYRCKPHSGMKGTVIVQPSPNGGSSSQ